MVSDTHRITIDTPISFRDGLPKKVDVAIIGGGVIGVFAALYLARLGKRVLICEKGRIAGEQSSRNWGWIRQHGRDKAELPIMMESLKLWHDVNLQTNGQCGVHTAGVNYLASTQAEMQQLEKWIFIAQEFGLDSKILTKKEVGAVFSGQSNQQWVGGVCTPSDSRGEPWAAVPVVANLAHQTGVLIREDCAVRAFEVTAGNVSGVITEDGTVECEQAVLAAGAWSSLLAQHIDVEIPQLCVRSTVAQTNQLPEFTSNNSADEQLALRRRADGGYTLALCDRHDFFLGRNAFKYFAQYLPLIKESWKDTRFGISSPIGFPDAWSTPRSWAADEVSPFENTRVLEPQPNAKYVELMVERFITRFPKIEQPKILSSWAGMIDAMPDVVPIVDYVPTINGLFIATGMSGHGFGIGPGFGNIIASMMTGKNIEYDLNRFRFSRFTDGSQLELGSSL